jgi:hypothetical protein
MQDLSTVATYTATDLNKAGGKVLDDAGRGPVEITRRDTRYVLLRRETLDAMLRDAREDRPASLDDLLREYEPEKVKSLTRGFLDDAPAGRERL